MLTYQSLANALRHFIFYSSPPLLPLIFVYHFFDKFLFWSWWHCVSYQGSWMVQCWSMFWVTPQFWWWIIVVYIFSLIIRQSENLSSLRLWRSEAQYHVSTWYKNKLAVSPIWTTSSQSLHSTVHCRKQVTGSCW